MRRILESDLEFAHLASAVPETLETNDPRYIEHSVVLTKGLPGGEAARQAKRWSIRLFGSESWLSGATADPPFVGFIRVRIG